MQWEGITEFVAVAETESFTRAAQRLSISTAQVSRQVSALEKRLNIKLFYRTTRKVSLTQEGEIFYHHCRGVLDGLDAAERAVSQLQSKPQGKINLTAPVNYAEKQILPLVNDFALQHPDIEICAYLTNQQVDLVEQGYDIAIRLGKLSSSTLMAKKLTGRTTYTCASPAYIKRYGEPQSLADLNQHNCLLGTLDYWRFGLPDGEKNLRVTGTLRYNSGEALLDAAIKGLGIVQLPDYYVQQHLHSGVLIRLLEHHEERDQGVWAVYPQNRHLLPRVRVLIDYLAEHIPATP